VKHHTLALVASGLTALILCGCWVPSVAAAGQRQATLLVSADVRSSCQSDIDGLRIRLTCGRDALDTARVVVADLVLIPDLLASRTDQTRTFAFARVDATVAALSPARLSIKPATGDILVTIVF
jgi:hypothetical protein